MALFLRLLRKHQSQENTAFAALSACWRTWRMPCNLMTPTSRLGLRSRKWSWPECVMQRRINGLSTLTYRCCWNRLKQVCTVCAMAASVNMFSVDTACHWSFCFANISAKLIETSFGSCRVSHVASSAHTLSSSLLVHNDFPGPELQVNACRDRAGC